MTGKKEGKICVERLILRLITWSSFYDNTLAKGSAGTPAESEPAPSTGTRAVELRDGADQELWDHADQQLASECPGLPTWATAATLT
jgi:hypothetical protein